jgi:hypothetical protein
LADPLPWARAPSPLRFSGVVTVAVAAAAAGWLATRARAPAGSPAVAPAPAPVAAAVTPAAQPASPPAGAIAGSTARAAVRPEDEPLYAGRPLAWWNERLRALAAQPGDEARRLEALTLRRAEGMGLRRRAGAPAGAAVLEASSPGGAP